MNASAYWFGYALGSLAVCVILGFVTKHINESKGYSGGFAWGFWLNLIGVIVVACKPDNRSYTQREYQPMYPQAQVQEKTWRCSNCGHENSDKLNYCLKCRSDRFVVQSKKITCPYCGASNNEKNTVCFACHKSLTEKNDPKAGVSTQTTSSDKEPVALIKQLADLHSQGILTDEEFETKKTELLAKM